MRLTIAFLVACVYLFGYDSAYFDYAKKTGHGTAVAVVAYNRPHYFKQLLDSIAQNPESQTLPFFFFLDGGAPQEQAENWALINASPIQNKHVIAREINYGCPKNHIDSKRFLFDWCHFDRIVVLEEDLLLSNRYFETLLSLDDWAHERYTNIGTVQLWSNCRLSRKEKQAILSQVREVTPHWTMVTYALRRHVWEDIRPLLSTYETFIDPLLGREEYQRARSKPKNGPTFLDYQKWIQKTAKSHDRKAILSQFDSPQWNSIYWVKSWSPNGEIPMNQDQITSFSIWLAGYTRLQTTVNRVAHIGEKGISPKHSTNTIILDQFPEDGGHLRFYRKK